MSENLKNFSPYFLNQDTSLNISPTYFKFGTPINSTHMEGTVSQIFYIGLSFHFMNSRKII